MTTQNHDTDPSTPGAKRLSEPRTPRAAAVGLDDVGQPFEEDVAGAGRTSASRSRPTTDPGIAPPPGPLPVPRHPMGIIVPPAVARANDSVDVLLDGISREQPEPARALPETQGQSAAAYHGEHTLRAARTSPIEEAKVVIDPATPPETAPVVRFTALPDADPRAWGETTAVRPQPLGSRVFIAIAAGVGVVSVIFVTLQRTSSTMGTAPPVRLPNAAIAAVPATNLAPAVPSPAPAFPPAAPAAAPAAPAAPMNPDTAAGALIPNFVAESLPQAPPAVAPPSATARPSSPAQPSAPSQPTWRAAVRSKPAATPPPPARPAAPDLGEFKSSL